MTEQGENGRPGPRLQGLSRRTMLGVLGPALAAWGGCQCEPTLTVYLVRHAEKAEENGDDPALSELGKKRADGLLKALDGVDLQAVYATQFQRTQLTVTPAAKARGLTVEALDAGDVGGVVAKARGHRGGAVLIAGHSNTVPEIARELGVAETIVLDDGAYGDLFVIRSEGARASLERRRFEPS